MPRLFFDVFPEKTKMNKKRSKQYFVFVIMLFSIMLLCSGCDYKPHKYMLDKETQTKEKEEQKAGIANPASVHCLNTSGTSWSVKTDSKGNQYGICSFSDGSWCEEWAYYRGHCEFGTNLTSCKNQFIGKSVCPPDYDPVCAKIEFGEETNKLFRWETFSNACKACLASTNVDYTKGYILGKCD